MNFLKTVIIGDDSFLDYVKSLLQNYGEKNIFSFKKVDDFLKWAQDNKDTDIIFFDCKTNKQDCINKIKILHNTVADSFLIISTDTKDIKIQEEILNNGVTDFLNKDITSTEFRAKINILKQFKNKIKNKSNLKTVVDYKNIEEQKIKQKQFKILKNELSMFFENDFLIETYFKPKEILNGDSILTKFIDKNKYFLTIIDAMGKGLSASLTSMNISIFLEHAIKKSIYVKDFNFKRIVQDALIYAKSTLLENETLSIILLYIENNKLYYANFGMPPIYTNKGKIKANNLPIMDNNIVDFNINTISVPSLIYFFSDGLIESPMKDNQKPYYSRFKKVFSKKFFLKELVNDFEKFANQTDDITIISIKKDKFNFEKIYETEFILTKKTIDEVLLDIYGKKMFENNNLIFILQELLVNTYEHNVLKISNKKEELIKNNKKLENFSNKSKINVKITIYKNENFIKMLYEENSNGFDLNILKNMYSKKYHGRGVKMVKKLCDGIFYNYKGNKIKIFLRSKNEI